MRISSRFRYLVPHDDIVDHFRDSTNYLETPSWLENGAYRSGSPNQITRAWLQAYRL